MSEREDVEEIALGICNTHGSHNGAAEKDVDWCLCARIASALLAYRERVRAEALREAAQIVVEAAGSTFDKYLARRIRALASHAEGASGASAAQPPPDAVAPSQAKEK